MMKAARGRGRSCRGRQLGDGGRWLVVLVGGMAEPPAGRWQWPGGRGISSRDVVGEDREVSRNVGGRGRIGWREGASEETEKNEGGARARAIMSRTAAGQWRPLAGRVGWGYGGTPGRITRTPQLKNWTNCSHSRAPSEKYRFTSPPWEVALESWTAGVVTR